MIRDWLSVYQEAVWKWCKDTFSGIVAYQSTRERNHRFLEEALELVQSTGMRKEDAIRVVDYVYGRPAGQTQQEVGGVMITLLALCEQQGVSCTVALTEEFDRINRPETQHVIRQKQQDKAGRFI